MLVLTRKIGERIICGEKGEVKIKLLDAKWNFARIGIEATSDIPVHREEIYLKIQNEKQNGESKNGNKK